MKINLNWTENLNMRIQNISKNMDTFQNESKKISLLIIYLFS